MFSVFVSTPIVGWFVTVFWIQRFVSLHHFGEPCGLDVCFRDWLYQYTRQLVGNFYVMVSRTFSGTSYLCVFNKTVTISPRLRNPESTPSACLHRTHWQLTAFVSVGIINLSFVEHVILQIIIVFDLPITNCKPCCCRLKSHWPI